MITLSPSLKQLANEVAPGFARAGSSDGWVADENHPPSSDHTPDANGIVHAIDIDIDGINYSPSEVIATALADVRTKYVIFEAKLYYPDGTIKPNSGHFGHIHISGKSGAQYENDTSPWFAPQQEEEDMAGIVHMNLDHTSLFYLSGTQVLENSFHRDAPNQAPKWHLPTNHGGDFSRILGAESRYDGHMEVFAQRTNGEVVHKYLLSGKWSAWESLA